MKNAFAASGSSPTDAESRPQPPPDFSFSNHGSICVLTPLTPAGREWFNERLPVDNPETQFWAGGIVIEPRYVADILTGIANDELAVRLGKLRPLLQEQNRVADSPRVRVTWCWWRMSQSYHGAPAVVDLGEIE
jgi:hypothetical protein